MTDSESVSATFSNSFRFLFSQRPLMVDHRPGVSDSGPTRYFPGWTMLKDKIARNIGVPSRT